MSIYATETDLNVDVVHAEAKNEDIEYRISLIDSPFGGQLVDFREFVKSSERWGRGVTMPLDGSLIKGLTALLNKANRERA